MKNFTLLVEICKVSQRAMPVLIVGAIRGRRGAFVGTESAKRRLSSTETVMAAWIKHSPLFLSLEQQGQQMISPRNTISPNDKYKEIAAITRLAWQRNAVRWTVGSSGILLRVVCG